MNEVAKTIYQQLGGNKFIAMTGAKKFVAEEYALMFQIPRFGKIRIKLNGKDLYDVQFIKAKKIATVFDLYFDQLIPFL